MDGDNGGKREHDEDVLDDVDEEDLLNVDDTYEEIDVDDSLALGENDDAAAADDDDDADDTSDGLRKKSVFDRLQRVKRPKLTIPDKQKDLRTVLSHRSRISNFNHHVKTDGLSIVPPSSDTVPPHPVIEYRRARAVRVVEDYFNSLCEDMLRISAPRTLFQRWLLDMATGTAIEEDPIFKNPQCVVESDVMRTGLRAEMPYRIRAYSLTKFQVGMKTLEEYISSAQYWLDNTAAAAQELGEKEQAKEDGEEEVEEEENKSDVPAAIPDDVRARIEHQLKDVKWWMEDGDKHDQALLNIHLQRLRDECTPLFAGLVQDKIDEVCNAVLAKTVEVHHQLENDKEKVDQLEEKILLEGEKDDDADENEGGDEDDELAILVRNQVQVAEGRFDVEILFGEDAFTINRSAYNKLFSLYKLNNPFEGPKTKDELKQEQNVKSQEDNDDNRSNDNDDDDTSDDAMSEEEYKGLFFTALYCMLRRYTTLMGELPGLPGASFEAPIPPSTMNILYQEMGVCFELCASPLNAFFPFFCSPFPDTDTVFCSQGPMGDLIVQGGSFECHPACTEEAIDRAAEYVLQILEDTDSAVSIVFVSPNWTDPPCAGLHMLESSAFTRHRFVAPRSKHSYVSGAAHFASGTERNAINVLPRFGTAVFVLQNEAGMRAWPCTKDVFWNIRKAFGSGINHGNNNNSNSSSSFRQRGNMDGQQQYKKRSYHRSNNF
eukprot:m.130825 g.130825  ORF g.130825 m.130825 type:complete len:716 (-) comp9473_c0_seq8:1265-3412(-)